MSHDATMTQRTERLEAHLLSDEDYGETANYPTMMRRATAARLHTTSDYRENYELRLDGPYDRLRNVFRIRFVRLLWMCVNAIILETDFSFVSPDYVCSPFTSTVRSSSTRVYGLPPLHSTNAPTIATSPNESLRVARRLSITSFEIPRYATPI